jgi:N-acetyl-gamma-glutamyl-phosphate reductase
MPAGKQCVVKSVVGTNNCQISVAFDDRANRIVVTTVIDNLVKGAAGQAIQNFNLMAGLPETVGLK